MELKATKFQMFSVLTVLLLASVCMGQMPSSCDDWAPADWDQYIETDLLGKNYSHYSVYRNILKLKATCPTKFSNIAVAKCFDRMTGYFAQFARERGGMYSGRMTDDQYLASQPQEEMELPAELKNSRRGLPPNWREVAKKNGWKFVLFHSGTANEGRLVIYLPGGKYDRMLVYYGFGDPPRCDPTTYEGLQMQVVEKNVKSDAVPPESPKYHFRSWKFSGPNETPHVASTGGRCVTCHISPRRPS